MQQRNVVIAGGGPVGLWLATELRRCGIPVTVVEERAEIDQHSKALTIHPRTIEVLASRGIEDTFRAEGVRIPSGHFGVLDNRLDSRALETPYPFTLALPQARSEELLEEEALGLGATILRGHRVKGFTESADAMTVQVEGPEGAHELHAAYLVGCEGIRSTVRTAAGIDFPGTSSTTLGWFGDVVLDHPPPLGSSAFNSHGGILIAPLPGGAVCSASSYAVSGASTSARTSAYGAPWAPLGSAACRHPPARLDLTSDRIEASSVSEGTVHGRRTMSESSKVATIARGNRSSSRRSATSSGWTP